MAAGIRLAHFGRKVCLLEQHHQIGGLNSSYLKGGKFFEVGLHAITNFTPSPIRSTPLTKILRQLRLSYHDLKLCPQHQSAIIFPGKKLGFTNNLDFLIQEIREHFPDQIDSFLAFLPSLKGYEQIFQLKNFLSARAVLASHFSNPLLREMLLCPIMFYGNCREDDMDFHLFSIMFRSIFCEGFSRPQEGMISFLHLLKEKYLACGGSIITNCRVEKLLVSQGRVVEVCCKNGQHFSADFILSSAGLPETKNLCSAWDEAKTEAQLNPKPGRISFLEAILQLSRQPSELGFDTTIFFFNDTERFTYRRPQSFIDLSSGVICCPNNYQSSEGPGQGLIRLTHLANYELWAKLNEQDYQKQKEDCLQASIQKAESFIPGLTKSITGYELFTPRTIHRFTGRLQGAVYGTPDKAQDGRTPIDNLFICGTDQGLVGIIGSMVSGLSVANNYLLY